MLGARVQPQGGPTRLSALARSLGLTHAFNFGNGSPITPNIVTGQQAISNIQQVSAAGGPGGRAIQFSGSLGSRLEVAGNPFATATCTYLWVDSGIDATQGGQAVVSTKYGQTNSDEQFGLQIRIIGDTINILSAQIANRVSISGRDNTGRLNCSAVSVASDGGRHAVFNRGRMLYGATPASTGFNPNYRFGTSAIGGAYDCTSSTVKYYALLFAPRALPDDVLRYLTANPWAMFEDQSDDEELLVSYAATGPMASVAWTEANDEFSATGVLTDRAAAAWTEGDEAASIASTVTDRGSLAWTEQGDSASLIGAVASPAPAGTAAAVAWVEAGDVAVVAAQLTNRAAVAYTEQGDTWAVRGAADFTLTVRYADSTIMRFSRLQALANLGPDRLQQTTGFP